MGEDGNSKWRFVFFLVKKVEVVSYLSIAGCK